MHYLSDVPTRGYNSYDWPPASPRGAPPSREAPWSPTQGDMSHHPYPAAPSVDSRASLHISSGGSPHQPPRLLTPPNSGNGPPAPFTPTSAGFSNPGNAYPPPYVNSRSVSPAPRSPRRSAVSNNVYPPPRPGPMNAPSSPAQYSYDTKSTEYQMGSVPVDAMRGVMSDLRRTVMESAASTASVGQPSSPSVNVAGGGTYGNSYENPSQQHAGYSAPSPNLPPHVLHGHPSARHLTHPARPILPSSGRTSQQGPLNVNSSAYSRTPFASSSASQQGPLPVPPGTILPGQLLFNPKGNATGYRTLMEFMDKGGKDLPDTLKAWVPVGKGVNAPDGAIYPGANRMVGYSIDWGQDIPNGPADHVGWIHTGKQTSVGLPASPQERIFGGNQVENAEHEIREEESSR